MKFLSHAKWILSGEHTVVRGGKAIAFPLRKYESSIEFFPSNKLEIHDTSKEEKFNDVFRSLLQSAAEFAKINFSDITGKFLVQSNIKMKSGLGSSAAICTNIAKIFKHLGLWEDIFSLATHLEDKFHCRSSGLDISVAMTDKAVIFKNNRVSSVFEPSFWPYMMLTYSGEKSATSKCAAIVKNVISTDPKSADLLNSMMNQASDLCELGLKNSDFGELKDGILLCDKVFRGWGLYNETLSAHVESLLTSGAVAAKPVGSGLGGFVLSLWKEKPSGYENIGLTLEKP
ncbi:MAG: hypothetical protein IJT36_03700 [Alphaproteobacteria bacterium]|nr:hypothetical protein [Alphaproteobacteria bacterium]